jgi:hypothetical protein
MATTANSRAVSRIGWSLYAISFLLVAVATPGSTDKMRGFQCAALALVVPLSRDSLGPHGVFPHGPAEYFSVLASGLINPIFVVAAFLSRVRPSARMTRILAVTPLAMIPCCWVVLHYQNFYPREGFFVWIAGMFLVLIAERSRSGCRRPG